MDNPAPITSPDPPKSDSTNLSVQTIIQRYDQRMANAATAAPPTTTTHGASSPKRNAEHLRTRVLPESPDSNHHLYNTPNFPKKDVEVFSDEPIVVHLPKKDNTNNASASSSITLLTGPEEAATKSAAGGQRSVSPFSVCIWLAVCQLLLCVTLTALGVLILVREATLARTGSGLWAGGIAGIAGALGVISNVRKARTGFLAVSLICVASSTLAMALTGIGLVRDVNTNSSPTAIAAASGLLAVLAVHFIVSVVSVYYSALQQCSRSVEANSQMVDNVICSTNTNHAYLSHQRVEQYFKSLPKDGGAHLAAQHKQMMSAKMANGDKHGSTIGRDKMIPVWVGPNGKPHFATMQHGAVGRPVILVPAGMGQNMMYPPPHHPILYPPHLGPPGMLTYPVPPPPHPATLLRPHHHHHPQQHPASEMLYATEQRLHQQMAAHEKRAARRSRRKSESDKAAQQLAAVEQQTRQAAFTYTGLDRSIADSFLEQQQAKQNESLDCTSLNGRGGDVVM